MGLALLISIIFPLISFKAAAAPAESAIKPITIRYRQRPPYVEKHWGELSGSCGDVVVKAFKKSKIEFQTVETPFLRQIAQFQSGDEQTCSVAWLKTTERGQLLKYSEPICDDGSWVIVGYKGTVSPSTSSAEDLLKQSDLKVARRSRFSFGDELDGLIEKHKTRVITVENSEFKQVFDMILVGRADYTFLPEREFVDLVHRHNLPEKDFVVLKPADLKGPHLRYMICSKDVPDAVINKFNKAVSSINP